MARVPSHQGRPLFCGNGLFLVKEIEPSVQFLRLIPLRVSSATFSAVALYTSVANRELKTGMDTPAQL